MAQLACADCKALPDHKGRWAPQALVEQQAQRDRRESRGSRGRKGRKGSREQPVAPELQGRKVPLELQEPLVPREHKGQLAQPERPGSRVKLLPFKLGQSLLGNRERPQR